MTGASLWNTRRGRVNVFAYLLARGYGWLTGWRAVGPLPPYAKYVVILAPHTSIWDVVNMIGVSFLLRKRGHWMVKHSAYRGPLRPILALTGAIPVYRHEHHNMVSQAVELFENTDSMVLGLAPDGTRSYTEYWKSGFYHIALQAQVPIVCAYLDYETKTGGNGMALFPTGNIKEDMDKIRAFYETTTPHTAAGWSNMRLRNEDAAPENAGTAA